MTQPGGSPTLTLTVPPTERYVGLVRHVVAQAARRAELSEERIDDVRVAVTEVVAIAVEEHGSGEEAPVRVEIDVAATFRVRVFTAARGKIISEYGEAGLGLMIAEALVDHFVVTPLDSGGSLLELSMEPEVA